VLACIKRSGFVCYIYASFTQNTAMNDNTWL